MTGIERINRAFAADSSIKLMTHIVGGYPNREASLKTLIAMAKSGSDIIEVQLPFSDPSADGPLIVEANYAALAEKVTTADCLAMLREVRKETNIPLLLMTYINPVFAYGIDRLIAEMVEIGLDGLIVPDYPPDEPELDLIGKCNRAGLAFVPLMAPSVSAERAAAVAKLSDSPFLYAVLRLGVTGKKTEISPEMVDYIRMLQKATGKKVAAGFGIREKNQLTSLTGIADCGIVGSGLLSVIKEASAAGSDTADAARQFITGLK